MLGRVLHWCRSRWKRLTVLTVLGVFLAMNVVAFLHARAFTRYVAPGTILVRPEAMTTGQKIGALLTGAHYPRPINARSPADCGLPFTTITFPGAAGTLEAWHIPADRASRIVVMFHGHAACKCGQLVEAKAFHDLGYEVFLVDLRASGGSTGDACTLGVAEADDVVAAVNYVRSVRPDLRVILYGQSMGSVAILRANAMRGVVADALVLECPFDRLLTTIEHRFEAIGVPAFPMARLLVFWGGVQHGFDAFAHNPVEYAASIQTPTLILHGARDPRVRTAEAESITTALAGPKRFVLFPEAGHESLCAHDPEKWRAAVSSFLTKSAAP